MRFFMRGKTTRIFAHSTRLIFNAKKNDVDLIQNDSRLDETLFKFDSVLK